MVLTGHDVRRSGPDRESGSIDPGKICPDSGIHDPFKGDLGDATNSKCLIALQIRTILRVPEDRIDDILIDNRIPPPGPDIPVGIHDTGIE